MSIDINNTEIVTIDDTHINVLTVGLTGGGGGGTQTDVTGNAGTATKLQTARTINGVSFDGSADITVASAAGTLTGSTLASGVTSSSLTSLGTISSLTTTGNATICGTGSDTLTVNSGAWTVPNAVTWTTTAASSAAETLCKWSVSDDSSSYLQLINGSATNSVFMPTLEGVQSSTNVALTLYGSATTDTGTSPVICIVGRTTSAGSIATRPLLDIKNNTTSVLQITGGNNLKMTGSSTSPTLASASADTVYLAAIDKSAAHRRLYIQSEAGSSINIGDDTLEFAASAATITSGSTLQLGKYTGVNTAGVSTQALTTLIGTNTDKGIVIKGAASQSGNLAEFQNNSGTPYFSVGPSVLSGASAAANYLNITGTFPSTLTSPVIAVNSQITGAGSSSQNVTVMNADLLAGYTGASQTGAIIVSNASAGTGATYQNITGTNSYSPAASNKGIEAITRGQGSGLNIGIVGQAINSSTTNYGGWFSACSNTNAPVTNVGLAAFADLGGTNTCAGFFSYIRTGTPSIPNAVLVCDNAANTGDIFVARDNGTPVVTITDGGDLIEQSNTRVASDFSVTSSTTLANVTGLTYNVQAGATYQMRALLFTTSSSAGGVKAAISGTATATSIVYEGFTYNATTLSAQTRASAMGTAVGAVTAVTVASMEIEGTITVNAAGTLTVQFAQNASSGTASIVLRGSTFMLKRIS